MRPPPPLLRLAASCGISLLIGPLRAEPAHTVVVGASNDGYPSSYQAADGHLAGFSVELLDAIARVEHLTLDRHIAAGAEINRQFEEGAFDCVQVYNEAPERQAWAEFSNPQLVNPMCLLVRTGSGLSRPSDLNGRRIVYKIPASAAADFLQKLHLHADAVEAANVESAVRAVATGEADAAVVGRYTALPLIEHFHLDHLELMSSSLPGFEIHWCFAVHRGNAALLAQLNAGLREVQRNGEYGRLWQKWFAPYEPRMFTHDEVLGAGAILLAVAFVAALWAFLRQRALHRALTAQSREAAEQRALLQALYDHIPTGMTVLELNAPAAPRVLSMNREAVRLYAEHAAEHLAEAVRRLPPAGRITQFEWRHAPTRRLFAVTLVPLSGAEGALPRLCVLAEDITRRKHADAEIAQSRKLRAVGELVGGIAHEFNNLLTPILLKVGELELLHPGQPGLAADLEVIAAAARRGADLTRRLLTFGRKSEAGTEAVRLETIVDACFHLLRSTVDRRISWENAVPPGLPPLRANATDLNQVLINLLLNARDALIEKLGHSPPGWKPAIRVIARALGVAAHPAPTSGLAEGATLIGWQQLLVSDNGGGIPAELTERIFEPFFTTKEVGQGTGLGLATVWHIVTEMGGTIEVESVAGEGTTFRLDLPVWDMPAIVGMVGLGEVAAAAPRRPAAWNVLVVDDEPLVSKTLAAMLGRHGHQVTLAADGREAEHQLGRARGAFDLVVLDVNLPGVDGFEVARRARQSGFCGRILLTSGAVDDALRASAASLGIDGVIAKPFTLSELDAAVGSLR